MVVINIFLEGGTYNYEKENAKIFNNTIKFRKSFNKLLSQGIDEESFRLNIEIKGSITKAVKDFRTQFEKNENLLLLIDLDEGGNQKNRETKLNDHQLNTPSATERVFFMVRESESWILSQPDKIELCYAHLERVKKHLNFAEDKIFLKPVEEIVKPKDKLKIILGRYFRETVKGDKKKKKYNELTDGAELLGLLDFDILRKTFQDVERFYIRHNK